MNHAALRNIKLEGLGLTADFLLTLTDRTKARTLLDPESYGLAPKEPVEEGISRSWDRLRKAYARWTEARSERASTDPLRYWITPLLQELGHTDLQANPALAIGEKTYPIRFLGTLPVHVTTGDDLDRITQHGPLRASAHGLVQEFLNRSDAHTWGLVLNGEKLRLLRDNVQVTRPAFVEFNLEEMLDQGDSAGFRVLWLLTHRSRFESGENAIIEGWNKQSNEQGTRANDALRDGVERAIAALGRGFIRQNRELRDQLAAGELHAQGLYRLSLKLVYQLVFLFVIEDRDLLHPADADPVAKARYGHYSTKRLRQIAEASEGSAAHSDAWEGLKILLAGMYGGLPFLGLPAFGGHLFERYPLLDLQLANSDLYTAVRALSLIQDGRTTKSVNFAGLDAEELGSIYESLLELHPEINTAAGTFTLSTAAGNERKTTGSYYTPTGLIDLLLESALDPVIEDALSKQDPVTALKALKVVDPACGSGHFLLAAARRIGLALARVEHDVTQPSPGQLRAAIREVISHCIYGVDINPMAIELTKVALWLESVNPGKPLTFLDHRLRSGNSLLGTAPDLMYKTTKNGTAYIAVPDEAFNPIEGDDKKYASAVKKQNKIERGQPSLVTLAIERASIAKAFTALDYLSEDSLEDSLQKEQSFKQMTDSIEYHRARLIADTWCAAFVWPKYNNAPTPPTTDIINRIASDPDHPSLRGIHNQVNLLKEQYKFFHWHIEFPEIDIKGGFDCVLGNPPWERIKIQEKEWFSVKVPAIAKASNARLRNRLIEELKKEHPSLYAEFLQDLRLAEGESHYYRQSNYYQFTAQGDINTYGLFAERSQSLKIKHGRAGIIIPTGIATDKSYSQFFANLINNEQLISLIGFVNSKKIFPDIKDYIKFCLLTLGQSKDHTFAFMLTDVSDVNKFDRVFTLQSRDFLLLNPNTQNCPMFYSKQDAILTTHIYKNSVHLINRKTNSNPWSVEFRSVFHMTNDAQVFSDSASEDYIPLYEAKFIWHFDHRFSTYEDATQENINEGNLPQFTEGMHRDPRKYIKPRYWTPKRVLIEKYGLGAESEWTIGFRGIASSTNERTFAACVVPSYSSGNSMPTLLLDHVSQDLKMCLLANLNSYVFDYSARQKVGGANINFYIVEQLPIIAPNVYNESLKKWICDRVLELTFTSYDLTHFANDLGCNSRPFIWDSERRFWLRSELDALYFHLYSIERNDINYIMETFNIVKRKDEAQYGTYRTKNAILEIYDEITRVGVDGYRTRLEPGPADERVAHQATVEA